MSDKYTWEQLPEGFRQAVANHPEYKHTVAHWNNLPFERRKEIFTRMAVENHASEIAVMLGIIVMVIATIVVSIIAK